MTKPLYYFLIPLLLSLSQIAVAEPERLDIKVLGLFKNKAIVKINNTQRTLKLNKRSPEGVLLVSSNSNEAVIEVDGKQETLLLGTHIGGSFTRDSQPVATIFRNEGGMFTTVGSINGFPVNFLLDTGATSVALNRAEAKRLGIDFRLTGTPMYVNTASGTERAWRVNLDRVQVGDITLLNVQGTVIEADSAPGVLLGMSFLGRLQMTNKGDSMKLKKKF